MADEMAAQAKQSGGDETVRVIARALWRTELPAKASAEEKKTRWAEGRKEYVKSARKLIRALGKEGATLTIAPAQDA